MDEDPIMKKVREARESLAKEAEYDLNTLVKILKVHEEKRKYGAKE